MRAFLLCSILSTSNALAEVATIPAKEVSLAGVSVGDSTALVKEKLGEPAREVETSDFLNLHYDYPNVKVSFSDGVVAGLYSDKPDGCTPRHLCPGDRLDRMHSLYGAPIISDRQTGRFYEYYGYDLYCWLQIDGKQEKVVSIRVECQP